MSRRNRVLMRKRGVKASDVTILGSRERMGLMESRWRAMTTFEESQRTLSQLQQSELVEFQDSKPNKELSDEELEIEVLKK